MNITNKLVHSSFEIYEGTIGGGRIGDCPYSQWRRKSCNEPVEYTLSHYPINLMISTGVCGGLNDKSKMGDFMLYYEIKNEDETANVLDSDAHLLSTFKVELTNSGSVIW